MAGILVPINENTTRIRYRHAEIWRVFVCLFVWNVIRLFIVDTPYTLVSVSLGGTIIRCHVSRPLWTGIISCQLQLVSDLNFFETWPRYQQKHESGTTSIASIVVIWIHYFLISKQRTRNGFPTFVRVYSQPRKALVIQEKPHFSMY